MFSVPLNPKLSPEETRAFVEFMDSHREYIYDFYFTCRMPPFNQDAMGDLFVGEENDHNYLIGLALNIQNYTGIKASAVFNNLQVVPNQQNLDLFIHNFKQLYEAGIRSATIPHTSWMATGQIKSEFPELFVKNTILRNVSEPRDIEKLAKAGFDYINLDRDLMRDHERLLRFKKAKEMFGVKLSLLANEGCLGGCIVMDEHYQYNNARSGKSPEYFASPISRISCSKWDFEDQAVPLKTANFPPWRADWQEFFDSLGIDVVKMHGRESKHRLNETMEIIKRYARGDEILFDKFNEFLEETNLTERPIEVWRKKIKTCKFDCWDCGYCDKIMKNKYGDKRNPKTLAVVNAIVDAVNSPSLDIKIEGLTSPRVQSLLNALGRHSKNYLEIGTFLGATAAAVLKNNRLNVHLIDNWKEGVQPAEANYRLPDNDKGECLANLEPYLGENTIHVHDGDIFSFGIKEVSQVDLFFYDGPHDQETVSRAIRHFAPCFSSNAVLVFDDANWTDTIVGVDDGLKQAKLNVVFSRKIINSIESTNEWWNGLYIVVLG